ncbi:MAG TPA: sigma-54 dependent transcriptional regulator, partial [Planctomycetaceae bacterium]|nr:sigma-54 dependent transcriptional regulator [Planctomycetaceae bacterium]
TTSPDLVFLDINMPGLDGLGVLQQLGTAARQSEIVVVTANDRNSLAVDCMRLGAADFLTKPFEIEQLRATAVRVERRVQLERRVADLEAQTSDESSGLIGVSRAMRELRSVLKRAAKAPVDLLICGETGTGKELVAKELHRLSDRAAGPFIAVNTAALPESLLESELFGHVKGAFTGADRDREGVFRRAHRGTLFLDEIGDLPLAAQAKLLRALQERQVTPVGSEQPVDVDVRVISATHQPLEERITEGRFRRDLYYRLKGFELVLSPLRARRDDILVLAHRFLEREAARHARTVVQLGRDAVAAMLAHDWPGNVRELEQSLVAAVAICERPVLTALDLGLVGRTPVDADPFAGYYDQPFADAKAQLVDAFERAMLGTALDRANGNISEAARQLGLHRQSLQQKLEQLGLRSTTRES